MGMLGRAMSQKVRKKTIQSIPDQVPEKSEERGQLELPGTISLEQARELIGDPSLTDEQVAEIKKQVRLLVEVIYEKWLEDQKKQKNEAE